MAQARLKRGKISGMPQVPVLGSAPTLEQEMALAAAQQRGMMADIEANGLPVDQQYMPGLGPIATARRASGDIAPGQQEGEGTSLSPFGERLDQGQEQAGLLSFAMGLEEEEQEREAERGRAAAAARKARRTPWDETRLRVAETLDKPVQSLGKAVDRAVGPHASQSLGRIAQAGDIAASMTPVLGDLRDMTMMGVEAADDAMQGDWWGAAAAAGLGGASILPGIFIGPKARFYPHDKADEALRLLWEGVDPVDIEQRTGAVFDARGIPRFEISDHRMKLTPHGETMAQKPSRYTPDFDPDKLPKMDTQVYHPELFANYPDAGQAGMLLQYDGVPGAGDGRGAFYTPTGRNPAALDVYAPATGPRNMLDLASHEIQHLIDFTEGAPSGANPKSLPIDTPLQQFRELWGTAFNGGGPLDAYTTYRMEAGENMANAVKARRTLTPEQRRGLSYYDSLDYPMSQQWANPHGGPITLAFDPWAVGRGEDPIGSIVPDTSMRLDEPPPSSGKRPSSASVEEGVTPVPRNGPRRRGAISGLQKTEEELLREAMETPRKLNRAGDFVGAPPGINTPEGEQALVDDLIGRLTGYRGTGELFYDEAQGTIGNWTDRPDMARRFVSSSGHTSNMMSPLPNTNYAVKGMNQYAVGDDVNTGMFSTMQSPKVRESFDTDTLSADPKTGPYSYALLPPDMRPADFPQHVRLRGEGRSLRGGAVHDSWDKIAFRYPTGPDGKMPAASDPEHLFMDRIYNKVASIVARNPELRARYGTGQQARERIQAALWDIERTAAGKFDVLPFSDILDETSGFTQMAAVPGPSTGIDQSFLDMPLDIKRQYTDDIFSAFSTPDGANVPARALGLSPPMREGFGPWQGMLEPNRTIDFAVATNDAGRAKVIDPSSAKAAETMRNWNQFALGQEGSGFTTPRTDGAAKPKDPKATPDMADIASISGVPLNGPDDFTRTFRAVEQVFGPQWADNVVVQQGRDGGLLLKNISGGNNGDFQGAVREVHAMLGGTGLSRARDVGNDFTYRRFDDPSYRTLMDETRNNPVLKQTFDTKVLPHFARLQSVSDDWAKRLGLPANTVPDRVRRIFIEAGERWPEAMDEAVRKGIIPAIAATAVYEGMYGQFTADEGGWQ